MSMNSPANGTVHDEVGCEPKLDSGGLALPTLMEPFAVAIFAHSGHREHLDRAS
jgi:hypothetical protein